jgi:tRNA pseudouridine38-40 synthase
MWLRATVAYDGTDFHGFQRQANARSVQSELEDALNQTSGHAVSVIGAGRTDAGVHASGQVIAFEMAWAHSPADLQKALNVRLPADVAVLDVAECEAGFHPRYRAQSRVYEYTVHVTPVRQPLTQRYAWQMASDLDMEAMNAAAAVLLGEHDFAAFGTAPSGEVTVRKVLMAQWREPEGERPPGVLRVLRFSIQANAFLYRMVRRIVMALVKVGRGQLSADVIRELLASKDSQRVKGIAPACGLCLVKVIY